MLAGLRRLGESQLRGILEGEKADLLLEQDDELVVHESEISDLPVLAFLAEEVSQTI